MLVLDTGINASPSLCKSADQVVHALLICFPFFYLTLQILLLDQVVLQNSLPAEKVPCLCDDGVLNVRCSYNVIQLNSM